MNLQEGLELFNRIIHSEGLQAKPIGERAQDFHNKLNLLELQYPEDIYFNSSNLILFCKDDVDYLRKLFPDLKLQMSFESDLFHLNFYVLNYSNVVELATILLGDDYAV